MTIPASSFLTRTLHTNPWGENISRILFAALSAVDPAYLIQQRVIKKGNQLSLLGETIDLNGAGNTYLLGIGKAALPMTLSFAELLSDQFERGYILTKSGGQPLPPSHQERLEIFYASHPIPDNTGLLATSKIREGLSSLNEEDLVILLISGGGSALFTQPVRGITLEDLQNTNQLLLSCGADIYEINTIRKHLSLVKGGQLSRHLFPARVLTLILSDVIGDRLDMIASGPTVPDPSTYPDAFKVIKKYELEDSLPASVIEHLTKGREGDIPETPKPGDPCFDKTRNLILASNQDALLAGASQAGVEGFQTIILPAALAGEARSAGEILAQKLKDRAQPERPAPQPSCLIAGGETTVTLSNIKQPGVGGRNLELALSALPLLDGVDNCLLLTLATDGEDGVSGAAGAVVSGESLRRCQQMGLDPTDYLARHDSYTLFKALDDLLITGTTGTNVNDLCFLFTF